VLQQHRNPSQSVTYGNGLFMSVSSTGIKRVMKSQDGITWTARGAPGVNECYLVSLRRGFIKDDSQNFRISHFSKRIG